MGKKVRKEGEKKRKNQWERRREKDLISDVLAKYY